jgi:hypothetical protein
MINGLLASLCPSRASCSFVDREKVVEIKTGTTCLRPRMQESLRPTKRLYGSMLDGVLLPYSTGPLISVALHSAKVATSSLPPLSVMIVVMYRKMIYSVHRMCASTENVCSHCQEKPKREDAKPQQPRCVPSVNTPQEFPRLVKTLSRKDTASPSPWLCQFDACRSAERHSCQEQ